MKYFIGVLVILFFVIVGVLLFTGRNGDAPDVLNDVDTSLAQYASDANSSVSWVQRGEVVALEDHYEVEVRVTPSQRSIEVRRGYDGTIVRRETFRNTTEAYRVFLAALDKLAFAATKDSQLDDKTGACPTGSLYTYRLDANMQSIVDSWSTSCSRRNGTFDGDAATVRRLFKEQIPEYDDIIDVAEF